MHGHYPLKLTASLARMRKTPLYSIIFVRKFVLYLMGIISAYGHEVLFICHGYLSYPNYLKSLTSHSVLNSLSK